MSAPRTHLPAPRVRGEGAERRRREAGEGLFRLSRLLQRPLARLPSLRSAIDLSPQAGRGEASEEIAR
jgi:hypothetical protein